LPFKYNLYRYSPAHRHGLPNYNLMLVLSGHKHVVAWPDHETPHLYPFPEDITPTAGVRSL
jgi:hypothetical protein